MDDNGNVTLAPLSPGQLKLIASDSQGVLYAWDDPLVLMRIAN